MRRFLSVLLLLICFTLLSCKISATNTIPKIDSSYIDPIFDVNRSDKIKNIEELEPGILQVEFDDNTAYRKIIQKDESVTYALNFYKGDNKFYISVSDTEKFFTIHSFRDQDVNYSVEYNLDQFKFILKQGLMFVDEKLEFYILQDGEIIEVGDLEKTQDKRIFNSYLIENSIPTELTAYMDLAQYAHKEAVSVFSNISNSQ